MCLSCVVQRMEQERKRAEEKKREDAEKAYRWGQLRKVFRTFDSFGKGRLTREQLMSLGVARRELGHKQGVWSKKENDRLMSQMDLDGDGSIDEGELVAHFHGALPTERGAFDATIAQFMHAAEEARCRGLRVCLGMCVGVA